jgi:hypothetical protein
VWFVTYGTYDDPDVPPRLIAGPMSFEKAQAYIEWLELGHCIKPEKP